MGVWVALLYNIINFISWNGIWRKCLHFISIQNVHILWFSYLSYKREETSWQNKKYVSNLRLWCRLGIHLDRGLINIEQCILHYETWVTFFDIKDIFVCGLLAPWANFLFFFKYSFYKKVHILFQKRINSGFHRTYSDSGAKFIVCIFNWIALQLPSSCQIE